MYNILNYLNSLNTKVIIIVAAVLIILIFVLIYFNKNKNKKNIKIELENKNNNNLSLFPLSEGSSGLEVSNVQKFLNFKGSSPKLKEDGIWGPLTQSKVFSILKINKIDENFYNLNIKNKF